MLAEKPTESYPLTWPQGRPRTPDYSRTWSRFDTTLGRARDRCLNEISLLGGRAAIISSNQPVRQDGLPYATARAMRDPGVAVYFTYKKRPMCFACDRWAKIEDNMHAIALTIGALRGIARWGTGDMMEAAFTGFSALPSPEKADGWWRDILGVDHTARLIEVEAAYRRLRSIHHPDHGGAGAKFDEVQRAWERAQQVLAG